MRKWLKYGYKNGDTILAMDGTKITDDILDKGVYWVPKDVDAIPFGNYALSSLYLTSDNIATYCEHIFEIAPAFIRGYPSFIYTIAQYAISNDIDFSAIKLKGIELTSETPMPYQIERIKTAFGCPVYLQYGHTEAIVFAYTVDESYRYQVEPLYGYVEILDQNDVPVQEGEIGEVTVTTLHNRVMPLIRYKTGDFAEYGGRDERYIYLNKVLGRTQDYIVNSQKEKVLLTALIFGQHNAAMDRIEKWQIEQFETGHIVVHLVRGDGYSAADEESLRTQFEVLGNVTVEFNYTNSIPLTPRGKSKMLIQHLDN